MTEEWRAVTGFEGLYEVSNLGRVRSLDREVANRHGGTHIAKGRVLCPGNTGGYLQVHLHKQGTITDVYVHQLVAEAFLTKTSADQTEVNHKCFLTTDNRASELEWVTPLENAQHAQCNGLYYGEQARNTKLTFRAVNEIRTLYAEGFLQKDIAYIFDISAGNVSAIITGRSWKIP